MSKKKRKKKRGLTPTEQAAIRARAAKQYTKLYARTENQGEEIKPATEGEGPKPYEGDVDGE